MPFSRHLVIYPILNESFSHGPLAMIEPPKKSSPHDVLPAKSAVKVICEKHVPTKANPVVAAIAGGKLTLRTGEGGTVRGTELHAQSNSPTALIEHAVSKLCSVQFS